MIIENIDTDSPSYQEEFFGPVFNLYKAKSKKQAIDLANKSEYGLSAAVFTQNEDKLEHAAMRLRSGSVFLNDFSVRHSDLPAGGVKGSGYGRECYIDGLVEMSNRKPIIRGEH